MSITERSVRGLVWIGVIASSAAGALPGTARAQAATPPPAQQSGSATDIGKVSTGPGQEQVVTPSAHHHACRGGGGEEAGAEHRRCSAAE
jgi:hypothetical protein